MMDWAVYIRSGGGIRRFLFVADSYEDAWDYCEEHGWAWLDENGFEWGLEIDEY